MTTKPTAAQVLEILDTEAQLAASPGSSLRPVALTKLWLRGAVPGRAKRMTLKVAFDGATPDKDDGTRRFISDQALGNEDDTRVQCPRCHGKGETEERTENATGYSLRHTVCWLCRGSRMVSPVACAEFRAWAGRKHE